MTRPKLEYSGRCLSSILSLIDIISMQVRGRILVNLWKTCFVCIQVVFAFLVILLVTNISRCIHASIYLVSWHTVHYYTLIIIKLFNDNYLFCKNYCDKIIIVIEEVKYITRSSGKSPKLSTFVISK